MAWSWSHSAEALTDAYQNVHDLDAASLREAYAEWLSCPPADDGFRYDEDFDLSLYEAAITKAASLEIDVLADAVWDLAAEQQTCGNGGFNAWICPSGCHTVPFDRDPS